jgi:hypothetical protein
MIRDSAGEERVLAIVVESPTPLGVREIARRWDLDAWNRDRLGATTATSMHLHALRKRGLLRMREVRGHKVWEVPPAPPEPVNTQIRVREIAPPEPPEVPQ